MYVKELSHSSILRAIDPMKEMIELSGDQIHFFRQDLRTSLLTADTLSLTAAIDTYMGLGLSAVINAESEPLHVIIDLDAKEIAFGSFEDRPQDLPALLDRFVTLTPILSGNDFVGSGVSGRMIFDLCDAGRGASISFCSNSPVSTLIPDSMFLSDRGYVSQRSYFGRQIPWNDRSDQVFWRGSTTGVRAELDDVFTLPRLNLCLLGRNAGWDCGIGGEISLHQTTEEEKQRIIQAGLVRDRTNWESLANYKYHIDIDGNTNSWPGLLWKLLSGGLVFKVDSPHGYRQWYYDALIPGENFVAVRSDLSNLEELLAAYRRNEQIAQKIASSGRDLALSLQYETEVSEARKVISAIATNRSQ